MTDKWFIQSYTRIFDKAQPSKTPLQWSNPRWMSGARWNEIHLARVWLYLSYRTAEPLVSWSCGMLVELIVIVSIAFSVNFSYDSARQAPDTGPDTPFRTLIIGRKGSRTDLLMADLTCAIG